jgi:hypothetical protein
MNNAKPSRPTRVRKNPVSKPEAIQEEKKQTASTPKMNVGNRYAPQTPVGEPTLGKEKGFVETIGLGNLKVITNGRTDV